MSKVKETLERIRDLPTGELGQALDRARDELFRLRLGLHTNQVENPLLMRSKRREIARIITVMQRRSMGLETQAQGSAAAAEGKEA